MPSAFRDPKTLPDWIELDYYQRPRLLRRWKRWFCWSVLLLTLGGVAYAIFAPGAKKFYQAGPVSPAHSMFNADCAICHEKKFETAKRLLSWDESIRAVPDHACIRCHDGPDHNSFVVRSLNCATCHREHQGRQLLARAPDAHCLGCHRDLKANHKQPDQNAFENVTGFPTGHPEFKLWRDSIKDPGQLRFNHKAHLKAEGIRDPQGQLTRLQCVQCHERDQAGRYMKPVNYERHCASCHPLSVQVVGEFKDPRLVEAAKAFNRSPAPHEAPALVRAVLRDRLLRFVQQNPVLLPPKKPDDLRRPPGPRRGLSATDAEWQWAGGKLSEIEQIIFPEMQLPHTERVLFNNAGGCRFCHIEKSRLEARIGDPGALPVYEPTALPAQWLEHARFDHKAHRMLNCTECHDAVNSAHTSDVLMPKMRSCAECHNPEVGGRHDCVECHTFHDRSRKHEVHKTWTIRESIRP